MNCVAWSERGYDTFDGEWLDCDWIYWIQGEPVTPRPFQQSFITVTAFNQYLVANVTSSGTEGKIKCREILRAVQKYLHLCDILFDDDVSIKDIWIFRVFDVRSLSFKHVVVKIITVRPLSLKRFKIGDVTNHFKVN